VVEVNGSAGSFLAGSTEVLADPLTDLPALHAKHHVHDPIGRRGVDEGGLELEGLIDNALTRDFQVRYADVADLGAGGVYHQQVHVLRARKCVERGQFLEADALEVAEEIDRLSWCGLALQHFDGRGDATRYRRASVCQRGLGDSRTKVIESGRQFAGDGRAVRGKHRRQGGPVLAGQQRGRRIFRPGEASRASALDAHRHAVVQHDGRRVPASAQPASGGLGDRLGHRHRQHAQQQRPEHKKQPVLDAAAPGGLLHAHPKEPQRRKVHLLGANARQQMQQERNRRGQHADKQQRGHECQRERHLSSALRRLR